MNKTLKTGAYMPCNYTNKKGVSNGFFSNLSSIKKTGLIVIDENCTQGRIRDIYIVIVRCPLHHLWTGHEYHDVPLESRGRSTA
jgi:hypothetical protein